MNLRKVYLIMKMIKNPSLIKISIVLIPIPLLMIYTVVVKAFPVWALVVAIVSLVSYLSIASYYCIKQKCYGQLILNGVMTIWLIAMFILRRYYMNELLEYYKNLS